MKHFVKQLYNNFFSPIQKAISSQNKMLENEIEQNRILLGRQCALALQAGKISKLSDAEFKVFSQWGEDGIIQYLISQVSIPDKIFVEFGVENYQESNTRFLLINNNWSGLVIDGSTTNIDFIRKQSYYWRHDLTAVSSFITAENINLIIKDAGIQGDIGILSIDIDGNDYWVWKAISKETISPRVVIVEYNSLFGKERAVTIPYAADFQRSKAHFSNLYYGTSLKAFCQLAQEKGYKFVGSNSAGSNAFFVRSDVLGNLPVTNYQNGYIETKVREGRDENGKLMFWTVSKRLEQIAHLPVIDLESGETTTINMIKR